MSIFDMKFLNFIGFKQKPKAPWQNFYKKQHMNIHLQNENLYNYLKRHMINYKNKTAIEYYGTKISYADFLAKIDSLCASF